MPILTSLAQNIKAAGNAAKSVGGNILKTGVQGVLGALEVQQSSGAPQLLDADLQTTPGRYSESALPKRDTSPLGVNVGAMPVLQPIRVGTNDVFGAINQIERNLNIVNAFTYKEIKKQATAITRVDKKILTANKDFDVISKSVKDLTQTTLDNKRQLDKLLKKSNEPVRADRLQQDEDGGRGAASSGGGSSIVSDIVEGGILAAAARKAVQAALAAATVGGGVVGLGAAAAAAGAMAYGKVSRENMSPEERAKFDAENPIKSWAYKQFPQRQANMSEEERRNYKENRPALDFEDYLPVNPADPGDNAKVEPLARGKQIDKMLAGGKGKEDILKQRQDQKQKEGWWSGLPFGQQIHSYLDKDDGARPKEEESEKGGGDSQTDPRSKSTEDFEMTRSNIQFESTVSDIIFNTARDFKVKAEGMIKIEGKTITLDSPNIIFTSAPKIQGVGGAAGQEAEGGQYGETGKGGASPVFRRGIGGDRRGDSDAPSSFADRFTPEAPAGSRPSQVQPQEPPTPEPKTSTPNAQQAAPAEGATPAIKPQAAPAGTPSYSFNQSAAIATLRKHEPKLQGIAGSFASDEMIMEGAMGQPGMRQTLKDQGIEIKDGKLIGDPAKIDEVIKGLKEKYPGADIDSVVSKSTPQSAQTEAPAQRVTKAEPGSVPPSKSDASQGSKVDQNQYPGSENYFSGTSATRNAQGYKGVVMHVTGYQNIEQEAAFMKKTGFGYQTVIDKDGKVYHFGNADTRPNQIQATKYRTGRPDLQNTSAYGIGFITGGKAPTKEQMAAAQQILPGIYKQHNIPTTYKDAQGNVHQNVPMGHGEIQGDDPERNKLGPKATPEGQSMAAPFRTEEGWKAVQEGIKGDGKPQSKDADTNGQPTVPTQAKNPSYLTGDAKGMPSWVAPAGEKSIVPKQEGGGGLVASRARFAEELKNNPGLREKILAISLGEQGSNPKGNQSVIESGMNRAAMMGTSLAKEFRTTSEGGYYAGYKPGMLSNPKSRALAEASLAGALSGSNISKYSTDNASGSFAQRRMGDGKLFTFNETFGGETFGAPQGRGARGSDRYQKWLEGVKADDQVTQQRLSDDKKLGIHSTVGQREMMTTDDSKTGMMYGATKLTPKEQEAIKSPAEQVKDRFEPLKPDQAVRVGEGMPATFADRFAGIEPEQEKPKTTWDSIKQGASDLYNKIPTPGAAKEAIQEKVEPDLKPVATPVEREPESKIPSDWKDPEPPKLEDDNAWKKDGEADKQVKESESSGKATVGEKVTEEAAPHSGANEPSGRREANPPSREIQRHSTSHNPDSRKPTPNDNGEGKNRNSPDGVGLCSITA